MQNTEILKIENISNANEKIVKLFYDEINTIDKKIIDLMKSKDLKFVLANKLSDVNHGDNSDIEKYQNYHPADRDIVTRGNSSDVTNSISVFANNVTVQNLGAILYHEVGHFLDMYHVWQEPEDESYIKQGQLSTKKEFITAYKNDISKNWDKIKNDSRFRLKHYIQNSTPDNIFPSALMETFAHCFARSHNRLDDIDIVGEYFNETLEITKIIYTEYLKNL